MIKTESIPLLVRKKGIREKLLEICRENHIIFMSIFGSFVRGEQKGNSDIDIAIEFDKANRKSLLDLVHIENEMIRIFGRKVDLGIFSTLHPDIIKDVMREMKVIYEKR